MNFKNFEHSIPNLTGALVLVIAICSFVLSFYNLQATASSAGINPWLSWLWPICVDALLISGSLMILRDSIMKRKPYVGWSVMITFTVVSMLFNAYHSPPDWVSRISHAVPPVALCISTELFMICIRTDIEQDGHTLSTMPTDECILINSEPCDLGNIDVVNSIIVDHSVSGVNTEKLASVTEYLLNNPDATNSEISKELGISRTTVTKYRKMQYESN